MLKVIEERKDKLIIQMELENCPYCFNDKLKNKGNYCKQYKRQGIEEYLTKQLIFKKIRYGCKNCKRTFYEKTIFKKRIEDEKFKEILKILIENNALKTEEIEQELKEQLKINDDWKLLKKNKWITIVNEKTAEIKKFNTIKKNKVVKTKEIIYKERKINNE